jgi:integrase
MHDVAEGRDPAEAKQAAKEKAAVAAKDTLRAVCEDYLRREGKKLRTVAQRESILKRHVYKKLGSRQIDAIERIEITRLLDTVEDESGPRAADMVLAVLRKIFNWHAARSNRFSSPVVRGMARAEPNARSRTLSDDELRAVWRTAEETNGPFGALVQFLLLTSARRGEAAAMPRSELVDGDWVLPPERNKAMARRKEKAGLIRPLSKAAQAILDKQPQIDGCPYVFTTGRRPLSGFSKFKKEFDKACGVTGWTLHDLRRTSRSLLSRAGVNADHAERCLGHVIGGVREAYDRYRYHAEMLQAYEALAGLIEHIISPRTDNVVAFHG